MNIEPLKHNRNVRRARVAIATMTLAGIPALIAHASFFDTMFGTSSHETALPAHTYSAQNAPLLSATGAAPATPEDYMTSDDGALIAGSGPSGSVAEMATTTEIQEKTAEGFVSTHTVEEGDTIESIAKTYGIAASTVRWGNNLSANSKLKIGQTLTIFPIDGIAHKITKGETVASIAKKYKGDADEIAAYNDLTGNNIAVGQTLFIPDGEMTAEPSKTKPKKKSKLRELWDNTDVMGYFIRPLIHFRKSQGIHGHNGVDLAGQVGEPIHAVAGGTVLVANVGGWGGGYGSYVVLKHGNGTQTLYGHMSRVDVGVGQHVDQGDVIGALGNSGHSTGPHLHIEVHGARNPF